MTLKPAISIDPVCNLQAFDYFAIERVQVIGKVEMTYLESMDPETRRHRLDRFWVRYPCVLISRNMEVPQYLVDSAKLFGAPLSVPERLPPVLSIE